MFCQYGRCVCFFSCACSGCNILNNLDPSCSLVVQSGIKDNAVICFRVAGHLGGYDSGYHLHMNDRICCVSV